MLSWFPTYSVLRTFLDGMLGMMILYSLLTYLQQRKAIYWQYALYILCMLVAFRLDDRDYSRADYRPGADYAVVLIESLAIILYIRFAVLLIDIPRYDPYSYRILRLMSWGVLGAIFLDTFLWVAEVSDSLRSGFYTFNRLVLAGLSFVVVSRILRLRQVVIRYFIAGSFFFVLGCVLALVVNFIPALFTREPTHPLSFPVSYMQVGVVIEVLCFTLGLSHLNAQMEADKRKVQAQLIEQLRENERKQEKLQQIRDEIARDLHDELGADLGGIGLLAQAAAQQLTVRPDQVIDKLVLISQSTRRVVSTMREIIWNLNSVHDTLQNVASRLEETARTLLSQRAIRLHLELPALELDAPLPAEYRRDLFLLFKEALHNLIRHSGATEAVVRLLVEQKNDNSGLIRLEVQDNGRGFDPQQVRGGGNGLRSMAQRAASLGGRLRIESVPAVGTSVVYEGVLESLIWRKTPASLEEAEAPC